MSARTTTQPATPLHHPTTHLRTLLHQEDALGMVYAETWRARRDNLPHRGDTACLLGSDAPGCDGLCAVAVVEVIEDVVGFYGRQLERGTVEPLRSPGGYARTIVRRRHLDVVRSLTTPEGGYSRPERLAHPDKRPAYLGLRDTVDGRILSAVIFYLRSNDSPTDWGRVCGHAEAACLRLGISLAPGEAESRLQRIVSHALADGGRAARFIEREVLELLRARMVIPLPQDVPAGVAEYSLPMTQRPLDASQQQVIDEVLYRLHETFAEHGGWNNAPMQQRNRALHTILGAAITSADEKELIDTVTELLERRALALAS